MDMKTLLPSKGFTLIETIVYVSILTLVMSCLTYTYYSYVILAYSLEQSSDTEMKGNSILKELENKIINHIPIPLSFTDPDIQNYFATTSIVNMKKKYIISFSINNHVFLLTQYE